MPIQQYVPTFGRMKVPGVDDYGLLVKQLSRFVKSDFVMKGITEYEAIDSSGGQLRYHALTPYHIVDQFDFDAAFNGELNDSRHRRISDVLDSFAWRRCHYWRDEGMQLQLDLDCGSWVKEWDVWFWLRSIEKEKIDLGFWKHCWEIAVKSLGFSNLVHAVDMDGMSMPDFRLDTVRHERPNASLDSRGFKVLTGHSQKPLECYFKQTCPNGTTDAKDTLDKALSSLTQLWGRDPEVETNVRRPDHGAHLPDAFWEVQKELVIWDRIYTRKYVGDMRKLIPITLRPQGNEIVVAQCFSVNPVLHSDIFQVPLEVCRVHTSSDLWIEFQVHDEAWLQKFADATGLPVEQWVGDHVSRWGWYAPVRPGDHSIAIHPSPGSKAIEVPESKPATKKSSTTKSTKKKSVKKK